MYNYTEQHFRKVDSTYVRPLIHRWYNSLLYLSDVDWWKACGEMCESIETGRLVVSFRPPLESLYILIFLTKPYRLWHFGTQKVILMYRAFHILPQLYTANHATFPIQMYAITVLICGNSEAPST